MTRWPHTHSDQDSVEEPGSAGAGAEPSQSQVCFCPECRRKGRSPFLGSFTVECQMSSGAAFAGHQHCARTEERLLSLPAVSGR